MGSLWVAMGRYGSQRVSLGPPHSYECCSEAAAWLGSHFGGVSPRVGLVCGSGLGALAEDLWQPHSVDYADIPHFPRSTGQPHRWGVMGGLGGVLPHRWVLGWGFSPIDGG